ncbi:MAG: phage tail sheath subtilisin-like domain-containing protein [Gammaproteobacteria bacterium]|nr:phage tail sheath subtilisin-like domain-containing protein [Gammaproteobacteria bacterium]
MPQPPSYPGFYVEEAPSVGSRLIAGVGTSVTAFVGHIGQGLPDQPVGIDSFADFNREFGGLDRNSPLSYAVHHFFLNGGRRAVVVRVGSDGSASIADELIGGTPATGMNALLDSVDFNLLCIPETFDLADADAAAVADAAIALCESRRAFYLVDPPKARTAADVGAWADSLVPSPNAALYFPGLQISDPLDGRLQLTIAASGPVAGVVARIDNNRGVWKAPAGMDAYLGGVTGLAMAISNAENEALNANRINVLRHFPGRGYLVWGARTLAGADSRGDPYKYVPLRRLALYIMESIHRGTQWTVFEINDESTWSKVRRDIDTFMHGLFRAGALQGNKPENAYYVHCGRDTTTQSEMADGVMNIEVGFAPSRPGEFLLIRFQNRMGDSAP